VRDLPIFEVPVGLIVPRIRVACAHCGRKLERLGWLEPYAQVTCRLAASVARLCKVMSILHVARFYGLAWTTVKLIDCRMPVSSIGPSIADRTFEIGLLDKDMQALVFTYGHVRVTDPCSPKSSSRSQGPAGHLLVVLHRRAPLVAAADAKVSPIPSSNGCASTLLVSSSLCFVYRTRVNRTRATDGSSEGGSPPWLSSNL
jgi:hypothetical protein